MLAEKLFIGERLDFEHYKAIPISNFEVEILDRDEEPFSFEEFDSIHFEIFAKAHGKSLNVTDLDVPDDNVIIINIDGDSVDLRPSYYFYECYGYTNDSPAEKVIFHYGVLEIIRS